MRGQGGKGLLLLCNLPTSLGCVVVVVGELSKLCMGRSQQLATCRYIGVYGAVCRSLGSRTCMYSGIDQWESRAITSPLKYGQDNYDVSYPSLLWSINVASTRLSSYVCTCKLSTVAKYQVMCN